MWVTLQVGHFSHLAVFQTEVCSADRALCRAGGVEQFNRELYLGAQAVAREADRMCRSNFEEESARLVEALARDLILPMDF